MTDLGPPEEPSRSLVSRWLSRADRYASRPLTAVLVVSGMVIWIVISVAVGFPAQARHQRATQRKLDEILLALPETDNALLALEHASDEELRHTSHQHRKVRRSAISGE